MRVVELFSGIGAQAKALERIDNPEELNILATCDWNIHAIIAYDFIHNGSQDKELRKYANATKETLIEELRSVLGYNVETKEYKKSISNNGKVPMTENSINRTSVEVLKRLLIAIERTKNLIDISNIDCSELPDDIDVLTYSFPCQDLSLAGHWHNVSGGIDRDANNRSSLLWTVGSLLSDLKESGKPLPKALLMENVEAITNRTHRKNFESWQSDLNNLGYINKYYVLNASDYGLPQKRKRTYMVSFLVGDVNSKKASEILEILDSFEKNCSYDIHEESILNIVKDDYANPVYKAEADAARLHATVSRQKIVDGNIKVKKEEGFVIQTITTKQDRNPNSGIVEYNVPYEYNDEKGKRLNYRYLTPRECFQFMGFDESDFENVTRNNFYANRTRKFFTEDSYYRMTGNSICVNVLEVVFRLIKDVLEGFDL